MIAFTCALSWATVADATDWHQTGASTAALLSTLIRADSSNPPGNETAVAKRLAQFLTGHRITSRLLESSPGRGNLVARVAGRRDGRPIVLLAHLDVVPADPSGWKRPPFSGSIADGVVHGRGALDAKGLVAVEAAALTAIASTERLDRDVILLATADEETGGAAGAGWIAREHPEVVDGAEFLLTEGDGVHRNEDGSLVVQFAVAEKTPCWLELTSTGNAGHGSTPARTTSVTRLVDALARLRSFDPPVHVTPAVADYFAALAPLRPEPLRGRLRQLDKALADPAFREEFLSNPHQNALVRNTLTPTVLTGSLKTNVIPAVASAQLDCRLLPGESPDAFVESVRQLIADDQIAIRPMLSFPASSSPADGPVPQAIRALAAEEFGADVPVIPSVISGFTDSHYFRGLGIASYGFAPFVLSDDDERGVHGTDEHVSVENLTEATRRLVSLLHKIDAAQP